MKWPSLDFDQPIQYGATACHFLDSGSFSLKGLARKHAGKTGEKWGYYDSDEFWQYCQDYAKFVTDYKDSIDHYANVDAIPNPDITYRNQKFLEKEYGLTPVPVVHYGTSLDWMKKYVNEGYEFIALGGLVGADQDGARSWLDTMFDYACSQPSRLPKIRFHGFGVTSYRLMFRYPWWSVDSTSWTKIAGYGGLLVPHRRKDHFIFTEQPYLIKVSSESPDKKLKGRHFLSLTAAEREIVHSWLKKINIKLGELEPDGETPRSWGVLTRHLERRAANLRFFEEFRNHLPDWPWAFQPIKKPSLRIFRK